MHKVSQKENREVMNSGSITECFVSGNMVNVSQKALLEDDICLLSKGFRISPTSVMIASIDIGTKGQWCCGGGLGGSARLVKIKIVLGGSVPSSEHMLGWVNS